MSAIKCWSAFCLIFIFSCFYAGEVCGTGVDGDITASSLTVTGLVSISSLTANNVVAVGLTVSTITALSSATIANLAASTLATSVINGSFPNPNILINGSFEFWQRTSSTTAPTDGSYVADRWKIANNATTVVVSSETTNKDTGTFSAQVQVYGSPSNKNWAMIQYVENYGDYLGKTVSLSVRMKCSVANACSIAIGDGASSTQSSYHSGGGNWEALTASKTISTSGTQLYAGIGFIQNGDMQNGTYYWDSAMLVIGNQPISFIPKNYEEELAQCQRYYEKSYAISDKPGTANTGDVETVVAAQINTTTMLSNTIKFKVTKRVEPTIMLYRNNATDTTGVWRWTNTSNTTSVRTTTTSNIDEHGFTVTQTDAVEYSGVGHWTADAEM